MSKKIVLIVLSIFLFTASLFTSSISEDAKKAIKQYVGYKELQNRGFNLNMLDKIQNAEDLYNVLLPYMVVDGKPLDNLLSFNGYNFIRHKTIKFENVYGTIQELLNKGYAPEQLFNYPSKGKDIYRVGNFIWEKPQPVSYPWMNINFYNRPFIGKKLIYFFIGNLSQNFFSPYLKEMQKKDFIILDLRVFNSGWEDQLYKLGESLCLSNYKGKVIFIIDKTTHENSIKNQFKDTYSINGTNKKINFEWITVGENTSGLQNYIMNPHWNYKTGDLMFNPLPVQEYQWKTCEEGEGIMPDIWAAGEEDINKTIELLTGENNFAELIKAVTEWRNFLCSSDTALWNFNWEQLLPDVVKKIKNNDEYNTAVAKLLKYQIQYLSLCNSNIDILRNHNWWVPFPDCAAKAKSFKEYYDAYSIYMESKIKWISFILDNNETINKTSYGLNFPECFNNCNSFSLYADSFSKWIDIRIKRCDLCIKNIEKLNSLGWWIDTPDCITKAKNLVEYIDSFTKSQEIWIKWISFLIQNSESLLKVNYWNEYPECFMNCNSSSVYITCLSKWIDKRIKWCELSINKLDGIYYTWWEFPEFFKSFKTAEQYTDYFVRWYDLRIWWCTILSENQYILENNNIRVWQDALKEEIKEWKNPDKHLAELTAYLEEQKSWIEYLQPHPYVIPKDYTMAKTYNAARRTSDKIGKDCSAIPEKIRNLQKTNPKEYVDKIVEYVNSVAENDFERVKLIFDIEQEILTYDDETFARNMKKMNSAKKGVGEDYQQFKKNLYELNSKDTEKDPGQDWKSVLIEGTCVCNGYANLTQYFCYKLGLKCDWVRNAEDMIFVPGHAWNIVEINGEHYCVDATWGPAFLYMEPEAFLKSGHFPKEPEQQLLEKPMTLDEYKKLKNYKGNNS